MALTLTSQYAQNGSAYAATVSGPGTVSLMGNPGGRYRLNSRSLQCDEPRAGDIVTLSDGTTTYPFAITLQGLLRIVSMPPAAVSGVPYDYTPIVEGVAARRVFVGSLPAGLTLNASSGRITGTPTAGGTVGLIVYDPSQPQFNPIPVSVPITLGTITLSGSLTQNVTASGVSISGATDGSTITFNIGGISVGTAGSTRSVTGTPVISGVLTYTETLDGAVNSPKTAGLGTVAGVPIVLSDSTIYNVASTGMRYPNKQGTIGASFIYYASQVTFITPPWTVASGTDLLVAFPNIYNIELNQSVAAGGNEGLIAQNVTITSASVTYTDTNGTSRVASASGSKLSNSGVLSSTNNNGGVLASCTLPADMAPDSSMTVRVAITLPDGGTLISFYDAKTGEEGRKSSTASFDTQVSAGTALSGNSGASVASINGFMYGPVAIFAKGADGRPTVYLDGNSLGYGKATLDATTDITRAAGIVEVGVTRTSNGYRIPEFNTTCAASGFSYRDSNDVNYSPTINDGRFALVSQVAALNGGKSPFTLIITEHGTNSIQNSTALQVTKSKASYAFLRSHLGNLPILQTTMMPKSSSTNGGIDLANQTPNGDFTQRFAFNDKLMGDLVDGVVQYGVNTYAPVAGSTTDPDRRKFGTSAFTSTLATALTAGNATVVLNAAPAVGTGLSIGAVTRIVKTVTPVGDGTFTVLTDVGSSSGTYAAQSSGTAVYSTYCGDADASNAMLHWTAIANGLAAPQYDAFKQAWRTAVSGTWFSLYGITVPGTPTFTATPGTEMVALAWTAPSNGGSVITGYKIYRQQGLGAEVLVTTVTGSTLSYSDTGLLAFACAFRVVAVNAAGDSASNTVSATPTAGTAFTSFATDTFTGTAGTQLQSHTADTGGVAWSGIEGAAATAAVLSSSNRVYGNASTSSHAFLTGPANADVRASVDLVRISSVSSLIEGVIIGSTGSTTYMALSWRQGSAGFVLTKNVSGTQTILATYSDAFASGTRSIELVRIGSKYTALVGGQPIITLNDSTVTGAGRVGIKMGGAGSSDTTGIHLDNYSASSRP